MTNDTIKKLTEDYVSENIGKKHGVSASFSNDLLCVGDEVKPRYEEVVLASGCGRYPTAIVVSIEPFVLVSLESDMRWERTVEPSDFMVAGKANAKTLEKCMRRLDA